VRRELAPRVDAELRKDRLDVAPDCVDGVVEPVADIARVEAGDEPFADLTLARRETVQRER
jgi:hypothetical protein